MAKRIILKHILNLGENRIGFFDNSRIVDIQVQKGQIVMWTEHDADKIEAMESSDTVQLKGFRLRTFVSVPTGQFFEDEGLAFLRTVQQGDFVWHFYERVPSAHRPN